MGNFVSADFISVDDYPVAAFVLGATAVGAVVVIGGVFYLVRRCRTRDIEQPADEQVWLNEVSCWQLKRYKSKEDEGRTCFL